MSGELVKRATGERPHDCGMYGEFTDLLPGSVFLCECGQYWLAIPNRNPYLRSKYASQWKSVSKRKAFRVLDRLP